MLWILQWLRPTISKHRWIVKALGRRVSARRPSTCYWCSFTYCIACLCLVSSGLRPKWLYSLCIGNENVALLREHVRARTRHLLRACWLIPVRSHLIPAYYKIVEAVGIWTSPVNKTPALRTSDFGNGTLIMLAPCFRFRHSGKDARPSCLLRHNSFLSEECRWLRQH